MTQSEFAQLIRTQGGDEEAALLIHQRLLDWVYVSGFTPYPDDKLSQIFGIAEEELDEDLILEVLKQLSIAPPPAEALATLGAIDTPLQIAQLVRSARVRS